MSGLQGYIYNKNNQVVDATITASVSASDTPAYISNINKQGKGNIEVLGQYAGFNDAEYEVMIADNNAGNTVVSSPVFMGAGSGKIQNITATGLQAQEITVLCLDTGIDTEKASIQIEGLTFRAKQPGIDGNNIVITISTGGLTFTDSGYRVINDIKQGEKVFTGAEFEWDTTASTPAGIVPNTAHRVAFGEDKYNIYLQYKVFKDSRWEYHFEPAIQVQVPKSSRVKFVTGGRTVTVTKGSTVETYTDIVSVADLWTALKGSNLIETVEQAIDTSRKIGSYALKELRAMTSAYYTLPYRGSNSSQYAGYLNNITVSANAKTELLSIECIDNTYITQEIWRIRGTTSGEIGLAQTGLYYEAKDIASFMIPVALPESPVPTQPWSYKFIPVRRADDDEYPVLCFSAKLGINARRQTITLTYKKSPKLCDCPSMNFNDSMLGFIPGGGDIELQIPDLLFWADAQFTAMVESLPSYHERYIKEAADFGEMKAVLFNLARRILSLNDGASLNSIVNSYKELFNTITARQTMAGFLSEWNGSEWSSLPSLHTTWYSSDYGYDTEAYQDLVDAILQHEVTYGSKKNSFSFSGGYGGNPTDEYYWEISGDRAYLPAYNDITYYSHINENGIAVNTKEFAFHIHVCGNLKVEDKIEFRILNPLEPTYKIGDVTYLPIYEGSNLQLTGGINGNDTYTWQVKGTVNNFANYQLNRTNPQPYSNNGLSFQIHDGVIPFKIGDMFKFALETGNWKWRKDGGTWSDAIPISQSATSMDSGLSIKFNFGVAPSFLPNDTYKIVAIQSNKTTNMTRPDRTKYKGTGNIEIDLGGNKQIDTILIADHNFTSSIQVIGSLNSDFSDPVFNVSITHNPIAVHLFTSKKTARYIKISNTGSRYIGYCYIGNITKLSLDADNISARHIYDMAKTTDYGVLKRRRKSFEVKYSSFIPRNDFELIEAIVRYLKDNNDLPMYFMPNISYTDDIARVVVDSDSLEIVGDIDYSAPKEARIYNLTLPLIER